MPPTLRIDNLWKSYSAGVHGCSVRVWALRGCSLQVDLGERVAIVGSRGSGKTTLLQCIAGARRADAGSIAVVLPIRFNVTPPREWPDVVARPAPVLLLLDDEDLTAPHRGWQGSSIVTSRDVASVHALVDRVVLLRDGRLAQLTRTVVRRVAECARSHGGGTIVR